MGPAGQAAIPPDVSKTHLPAALQAFPSPASITDSLESPSLHRILAGDRTLAWTPRSLLPETADVVASIPGQVNVQPIMTPPLTEGFQTDMDTIVGGALAPVHNAPPAKPHLKAGPGLRLPSFEALGIAAPHPDRFGESSLDGTYSGAPRDAMRELLSQDDAELVDMFARLGGGKLDPPDGVPSRAGRQGTSTPVRHYVTTLTPPAEAGEINWQSMATVSSAPLDTPATDPGANKSLMASAQASPGAAATGSAPSVIDEEALDEDKAWVRGAVHTLSKSHLASNCIFS